MTLKEFINEAPFGCSFMEMVEYLEENGFSIDGTVDDLFPTAIEIEFSGFDEEFDETVNGNISAYIHVFLTDEVIETVDEEDDEAEELYDEIIDLANNELWDDLCDYLEAYYVTISSDGDLDVEINWKHSGMSDKEWNRLADR